MDPVERESKKLHVYCDESGWNSGRFMVFGGIVVPVASRDAVRARFALCRERHGMFAELKWGKVSRSKLAAYEAFVDVFFERAAIGDMDFKAVVFERPTLDARTFHRGDELLAFDKLFYQFLLVKFCRLAVSDRDCLYVFLDEKERRTPLERFREILNSGARRRYGLGADVVRTVDHVNSHDSDLVQLADVLMGAVRYQYAGEHMCAGASSAKCALSSYIAAKAGLSSLCCETPPDWPWVDIWKFRPSGRGRATP